MIECLNFETSTYFSQMEQSNVYNHLKTQVFVDIKLNAELR